MIAFDFLAMVGWRPFITAAPIWGLWWLLLIPMLIGVALAYKATKSPSLARLPWEVVKLTATMLGFYIAAGIVVVLAVEWWL